MRRYAVANPRESIATASAAADCNEPTNMPMVRAHASASTDRGERAARRGHERAGPGDLGHDRPKVCTRCRAAATATTGRAGAAAVARGGHRGRRRRRSWIQHGRGHHDDEHPQPTGEGGVEVVTAQQPGRPRYRQRAEADRAPAAGAPRAADRRAHDPVAGRPEGRRRERSLEREHAQAGRPPRREDPCWDREDGPGQQRERPGPCDERPAAVGSGGGWTGRSMVVTRVPARLVTASSCVVRTIADPASQRPSTMPMTAAQVSRSWPWWPRRRRRDLVGGPRRTPWRVGAAHLLRDGGDRPGRGGPARGGRAVPRAPVPALPTRPARPLETWSSPRRAPWC